MNHKRKHAFRGHGHRNKHCCNTNHHSLIECESCKQYKIITNTNRKLMELGFYNENIINVIRNQPNEGKMIIGIGCSRYILSYDLALGVIVEECS